MSPIKSTLADDNGDDTVKDADGGENSNVDGDDGCGADWDGGGGGGGVCSSGSGGRLTVRDSDHMAPNLSALQFSVPTEYTNALKPAPAPAPAPFSDCSFAVVG